MSDGQGNGGPHAYMQTPESLRYVLCSSWQLCQPQYLSMAASCLRSQVLQLMRNPMQLQVCCMHLVRLTIEPLHESLARALLRQRFFVVTKAQRAGFEGACGAYGRERQQAPSARLAIAFKERHDTTSRPHMLSTHATLRVGGEPRSLVPATAHTSPTPPAVSATFRVLKL